MQIGLVGAPSAGKSTFFKAATLADVDIANYPFTTIKPNAGVGHVRVKSAAMDFGKEPNPRNGFYKDGIRFVPMEIIDVAGLVPGASEGKGMGSQFLNDLNQADVLVHVVDASGQNDEKGEPTKNHDPCVTVRFLEKEIDLWYESVLAKALAKHERQNKDLDKMIAKQMSAFKVTEDMAKQVLRKLDLLETPPAEWDQVEVAKEFRKLTKPIIIAANKADSGNAKNNIERMRNEFPDYTIISCSADYELALREADKKGMIKYLPGSSSFEVNEGLPDKLKEALEKIKLFLGENESTGVQQILDTAVFDFLDYVALFPGGANKLEDSQGRVLPDCFLMPNGTTAQEFAMRIHGDIGKGMLYGIDCRTKQKIKKEHVLKHRDVVEIITTAK